MSMPPLHSLGQNKWNEVQHDLFWSWCHYHCLWHQVILMVSSMASLHSLAQDDQNKVQYHLWVMWCHWYQWHMTLLPANTGTSTGTKNHISLNNHLNMTNAMISLMVPLASNDKKHVIAMYLPKSIMPLKCQIQATNANQIKSSYETTLSAYMYHINPMQSTMWPEALTYIYFTLLAYTPEQYASNITYICPTAMLLWYTYRPYITVHTSPKKCNF